MPNHIPPMTHELGKYWSQPNRDEINFRNGFAVMNKAAFDKLPDYTGSHPGGAYEGKMWKRLLTIEKQRGATKEISQLWHLCWYATRSGDRALTVNYIPISVTVTNLDLKAMNNASWR